MTLALSLPAVEARPAHPPETRPARVQPWLEETLKRDPIEAAATIGDALAFRMSPLAIDDFVETVRAQGSKRASSWLEHGGSRDRTCGIVEWREDEL